MADHPQWDSRPFHEMIAFLKADFAERERIREQQRQEWLADPKNVWEVIAGRDPYNPTPEARRILQAMEEIRQRNTPGE